MEWQVKDNPPLWGGDCIGGQRQKRVFKKGRIGNDHKNLKFTSSTNKGSHWRKKNEGLDVLLDGVVKSTECVGKEQTDPLGRGRDKQNGEKVQTNLLEKKAPKGHVDRIYC